MNALAPIAGKLAKLAALLGSDKPGEVAAAAAAIGRLLATVGLDFHDLVPLLASIEEPTREMDEDEAATWVAFITECLALDDLSNREKLFLHTVRRRAGKGQRPTPKQEAWISAISRRRAA